MTSTRQKTVPKLFWLLSVLWCLNSAVLIICFLYSTRQSSCAQNVGDFFGGSGSLGRYYSGHYHHYTPPNNKIRKQLAAFLGFQEIDFSKDYEPAFIEDYVLRHSVDLGLDASAKEGGADGCAIWRKSRADHAHPQVYDNLHMYLDELEDYASRVDSFSSNITDLRSHIHDGPDGHDICNQLSLHTEGMFGIFKSRQLSKTSSSGYVEPLLPPLRHPKMCFFEHSEAELLDLRYLVHDFEAICKKLKPRSKTILIDMGASLDFHDNDPTNHNYYTRPALYLMDHFARFGIPFDHVYAYEVTPNNPAEAYMKLPDHYKAAYHWLNFGVSPDPDSPLNPLQMLVANFHPDDLVVIKLDIDTASVELPLANQLLHDKRIAETVDAFYFEHHVFLQELSEEWNTSMKGTVQDSLQLFHNLRQRGVAAHYWV